MNFNIIMRLNPYKSVYLAGFITFLGYALMHFTYRSFNIWKIYPSASIKLIFRSFNISTEVIFANGSPTVGFLAFLNITGLIFLLTAFLCLWKLLSKHPFPKIFNILFVLSAVLILAHAYASFIQSKLHYNVPFEYFTRIALPFLCLVISLNSFSKNKKDKILERTLPVVIAITFLAHGLYAIQFLPIPQDFLLMTTNILRTPRSTTINILYVVGVLDILLFIGIFIKRVRKYFLYYAIIWGFLTALARLVAYYNPSDFDNYLNVWVPQFLVRSGHYLLPLALLLLYNQKNLLKNKT